MKLLAIDTVTEACSAALLLDGEVVEKYEVQPRRHTELILPMVDALLAEAGLALSQLDAIAVDRGPGSFTGVRISTGVVQGLAFSADLAVVPISSLAALAQAVWQHTGHQQVLPMIDARMQEVYWGEYRLHGDEMRLQGEEQVGSLGTIPAQNFTTCVSVGSGAQQYQQRLMAEWHARVETGETLLFPRAAIIAQLGSKAFGRQQSVAAESLEPVYLRNQVVKSGC